MEFCRKIEAGGEEKIFRKKKKGRRQGRKSERVIKEDIKNETQLKERRKRKNRRFRIQGERDEEVSVPNVYLTA